MTNTELLKKMSQDMKLWNFSHYTYDSYIGKTIRSKCKLLQQGKLLLHSLAKGAHIHCQAGIESVYTICLSTEWITTLPTETISGNGIESQKILVNKSSGTINGNGYTSLRIRELILDKIYLVRCPSNIVKWK